MPKRTVNTGSAIGPYSSAVVAGNHCYVAGTGGFTPGTNQLVGGGIAAEIKQALDNLASTVEASGFRLADVVSVTCYLRSMDDWPLLNEIYSSYFQDDRPARAAVGVDDMPGGVNVEFTCVAWRDETS